MRYLEMGAFLQPSSCMLKHSLDRIRILDPLFHVFAERSWGLQSGRTNRRSAKYLHIATHGH